MPNTSPYKLNNVTLPGHETATIIYEGRLKIRLHCLRFFYL